MRGKLIYVDLNDLDTCCSNFHWSNLIFTILVVVPIFISWHEQFNMSVTISLWKRCSVFLYLQLFVGGLVFYLCYLCLLACGGVKNGQSRKLATSRVQRWRKTQNNMCFTQLFCTNNVNKTWQCVRVKPVNGIPILYLDNWISNKQYIYE